MSWVAVRRFTTEDPEALRAKKHWEDVAEDLGLLADANVRLEEEGADLKLYVSEALNEFFQGQPGRLYS